MALEFPAIDPVLISIGPFDIRWYALAYLAGFLLGWRYAMALAGRLSGGVKGASVTKAQIDDFLPWAIVGVIIGGRLGYALIYQPGYYLANPLEMAKVWKGGMSFHGGLSGVLVSMMIYAWRHKLSFLRLSDIICCAAPIGLFFGRIANFINGELYGRESDVPWAMVFPTAAMAGEENLPRHPSQLYQALLEGLLLFCALYALTFVKLFRTHAGFLSACFISGYGIARFTAEFFRSPDGHIGLMWGGMSMGQWLCVPMIISGLLLAIYLMIKRKAHIKQSVHG
jgi:phosphatidylglycerol:prolipoprotein diacylglycerol transferase